MPELALVTLAYAGGANDSVHNPLSGLSEIGIGGPISAGDSVLVFEYAPDPTKVGVWTIQNGPWTRREDWNSQGEMVFGTEVIVRRGNYGGDKFRFAGNPGSLDPPVPDVDPQAWFRVDNGFYHGGSAGIVDYGMAYGLGNTGVLPGYYDRVLVNPDGRVYAGEVSPTNTAGREGMRVYFQSTSRVGVTAGNAGLPGGDVLTLAADTLTGTLQMSAATWYYVYVRENAGIAEIEVSTQRPALPYLGAARVKGGPNNTDYNSAPDASRRYVGAFRTRDDTNSILRWTRTGDWVMYAEDGATRLRILSANAQTARAVRIGARALVPPTSRLMHARINTNATAGTFFDANELLEDTTLVTAGQTTFANMLLDAEQQFGQRNNAAGGSTNIDVLGYLEEA